MDSNRRCFSPGFLASIHLHSYNSRNARAFISWLRSLRSWWSTLWKTEWQSQWCIWICLRIILVCFTKCWFSFRHCLWNEIYIWYHYRNVSCLRINYLRIQLWNIFRFNKQKIHYRIREILSVRNGRSRREWNR